MIVSVRKYAYVAAAFMLLSAVLLVVIPIGPISIEKIPRVVLAQPVTEQALTLRALSASRMFEVSSLPKKNDETNKPKEHELALSKFALIGVVESDFRTFAVFRENSREVGLFLEVGDSLESYEIIGISSEYVTLSHEEVSIQKYMKDNLAESFGALKPLESGG